MTTHRLSRAASRVVHELDITVHVDGIEDPFQFRSGDLHMTWRIDVTDGPRPWAWEDVTVWFEEAACPDGLSATSWTLYPINHPWVRVIASECGPPGGPV